jgi:hypothetical protein
MKWKVEESDTYTYVKHVNRLLIDLIWFVNT